MKKNITLCVIMLLTIGIIWFNPDILFASNASTIRTSLIFSDTGNDATLTITCTGDDANGDFDSLILSDTGPYGKLRKGGYQLFYGEVIPGSPGPTASTDLWIKNSRGTDLLAGGGVDIIANATITTFHPAVGPSSTPCTITVDDTLTISFNTEQDVNSAVCVIVLHFIRE